MNIAIIGCGLAGQKRANQLKPGTLLACIDTIRERAEYIANQHLDCTACTNWETILQRPDISLVVIATHHSSLAEIALAMVNAGKHVLIEKPAGTNAAELDAIIKAAKKNHVRVRVGFNHRYHPAMRKARELVDKNEIGDLMFIRARYGHGGRIGYEKEWRAQPALAGGGELLDQGVHLIDLARWFLGDFTEVQGFAHTYYWDMPVEDNGFLLLKTANKQVAHLHASCTEWKNTFSFEIYGRKGKIDINGLGGSYGTERLSFYKLSEKMGPPETTIWEYPMADTSWSHELCEFIDDINHKREPAASLHDAQAALRIVEEIYRVSNP
jgi:predicted dehydrogenase